jgi:Protein of unknown function (DUF742)
VNDSPRPPRFLRQYALTQGRVHSIGRDLPLDTLVQASEHGLESTHLVTSEQAAVLRMTERPLSIAEIGAHLHVHLGIARVLVSDMCARELVAVSTSDFTDGNGPDLETLERLFDDLSSF